MYNQLTPLKYSRFILVSVITILLLRIFFVGTMGLMPQDAYYYFYSEHLSLSYFDHPPAVAYMLWLFTNVFGKSVLAIKLADFTLTLVSLFCFYHLAKSFISRNKAAVALSLFFSTFMVSILSLVTTPDVPLILFWTLSLLFLHRAIFLQKKYYWLLAGLAMGLAFDSKYTGLFLPAGLVLFLLVSNTYRRLLITKWFCLCVLFFLIAISPVIIWNFQHDFASFRFQSSGRVSSIDRKFSPTNFLGLVAHQTAILLPVLMAGLVIFLIKFFKKYTWRWQQISSQQLFLLCFFVPLFFLFTMVSFIYWVKLNWIMPAYLSGIILLAPYFKLKWLRVQFIISVLLHILLAIELIFYIVPVQSDDTWAGWKPLSEEVNKISLENKTHFVFSADNYKTSAVLDFYLDQPVLAANVIGQPALEYDFAGIHLNDFTGQNALFINSVPRFKTEGKENDYPAELTSYFDSITEIDPILIKQNGKTIRKFLVFQCINYHPPTKNNK